MTLYNWKTILGAGAFTSLVMSVAPSFAQSQKVEGQSPESVNPAAREEILNDSRTSPSAEAATTAKTRGVPAPVLDIDSSHVDDLIERATAAASCNLAELEFDVGSAELSEQDRQALVPVAQCLKNQNSAVMWLIGEADNQGSDAANWVLAMNRAVAVKDALRAMGVAERKLKAVSAGPTGERAVSFALAEAPRDAKLATSE